MADLPAATMDSAPAREVLGVEELFENILLHLDNRTLLLSQRTSKKFKISIDRSVKLQRKLFFQQGPDDYSTLARSQRTTCFRLGFSNPLIPRIGGFDEPKPLLHDDRCGFFYIVHEDYSPPNEHLYSLNVKILPSKTGDLKCENGKESWRRMHLTKRGFTANSITMCLTLGRHGLTSSIKRMNGKSETYSEYTLGQLVDRAVEVGIEVGRISRP